MTATLTDNHPTLFGEIVDPVEAGRDLTLAEQFAAFHDANPQVLRALEHLARQWFDAGHNRVGVKALWEQLRWQTGVQTGTTPRLNNNLTAFYARLLIERNPDWAARIHTRTQKAAA